MDRQVLFARRGKQPRASEAWLSVLLGSLAVVSFTVGALHLWQQAGDDPSDYRAASGVLLWLTGLVQAAIAWRLRHHQPEVPAQRADVLHFVEWQIVGVVVALGCGYLVGPGAEARYLVRAVIALWLTLTLLPVVMPRHARARWAWIQSRGARAVGWSMLAVSLILLGGEGLLRVAAWLDGEPLTAHHRVQALKFTPGESFADRVANEQGYLGERFVADVPLGHIRVAVLGSDVPLASAGMNHFLDNLHALSAPLNVYNFGLRHAGLREFTVQVTDDVQRYHPQLVVAMFDVSQELVHNGVEPQPYDWHALRLSQWAVNTLRLRVAGPQIFAPPTSADYETFLRQSTASLQACRTPIEASIEQRWTVLQQQLDQLATNCDRYHLPLAVVLVPSPCQVSDHLRDTLARRQGVELRRLDMDLPQRRLSRYAQQRNVAVIDLLPYFRAARQSPFQPQSGQLSAAGHDITADVLGAWIESRYARTMAHNRSTDSSHP